VAERASRGGHGVPEDKIIARYKRSMDLMFDVLMVAHNAVVYDNSDDAPEVTFSKNNGSIYRCFKRVAWVESYLLEKAAVQGIQIHYVVI
jgi:predicted ABC-type ATPase